MLLILRQFFQFFPVCREYLGFGNEPHISPVLLHDRQVPGIRILELFITLSIFRPHRHRQEKTSYNYKRASYHKAPSGTYPF